MTKVAVVAAALVLFSAQAAMALMPVADAANLAGNRAEGVKRHIDWLDAKMERAEEHADRISTWRQRLNEYKKKMQKITCTVGHVGGALYQANAGFRDGQRSLGEGRDAAQGTNNDGLRGLMDRADAAENVWDYGEAAYDHGERTVKHIQSIADCYTTGDDQTRVRNELRAQMERQREIEAALEAVEGANYATDEVALALHRHMVARDGRVNEVYGNLSPDQRDRVHIATTLGQATQRHGDAQRMRREFEWMEANAAVLRTSLGKRIASVEGMMEVLQLSVRMEETMSTQLSAIVRALGSQSRILESMHAIAVRELGARTHGVGRRTTLGWR